ncbi:MAG: YfiR family protein [Deltaproteobacteria bacterium]|nr:YfiR family protein [Deltaproteobacteria bacterium]TLN03885.1 MAG: YfiR family protein [bacterium]
MAFLIRADAIDRDSDPQGYLHCTSAMRKKMRFSGLFLLVLMLCLSLATPRELHAGPVQAGEYQVKAAFLLNFAKFVEWPAGHVKETFTIGILGRDPFDSALDSLSGKTVRGKRVVVRRYQDPDESREADILFISASEKRELPRILKTIRGNSILTVGDSKDFGRSGVMINLLLLQKRVGFEINLAAAQRDGLQISSNLLKLAQEVIE